MVDSRKFLCCLPVRLGVFVLSFFSFVGGGILAAAIWYEFSKTYNITPIQKAAFIIGGASWSILALFSFFGLLGSILRRLALVSLYAGFMWIHFWVDVGVSAFFIYALYTTNTDQFIQECIAKAKQVVDKQQCEDALKIGKIVYIVIVAVLCLIQLYCAIIVSRYVTQLKEEASFKAVNRLSQSSFSTRPAGAAASYYPHKPLARGDPDEHHELLHSQAAYPHAGPHHSYPYADPHNSFGSKV